MRILIAEDEVTLAKMLVKILERHHYSADAVYNGEDALAYLESGSYDGAILDIMMPKKDGMTVLKEARSKGIHTPILLLTAKSEIEDKVEGLDSGADDYLTKPFDARELLARIRAMTRAEATADSTLTFGNLTLDRAALTLSSPTGSLRLTSREFQMMEMLMTDPKRVISVELFMEKIWGFDSDAEINVVWVYISRLRKHLTTLEADIRINAFRNAGYSLEALP